MLAGFLGYHIITRVPPLLHTPLMSATNAIAAISLVGSLVVAGSDYSDVPNGWVCTLLGFIAVTCSATNVVGGFLITDRMLRMFKTAEERARGTRRPVELQAFGFVAGRRRGRRGAALRDQAGGHGDGRVPPRARRSGGAALLLHRLGGDVHPGPEGPELAQVGALGHVAGRVRHVRRRRRHALPPAHRRRYRWIALGFGDRRGGRRRRWACASR